MSTTMAAYKEASVPAKQSFDLETIARYMLVATGIAGTTYYRMLQWTSGARAHHHRGNGQLRIDESRSNRT